MHRGTGSFEGKRTSFHAGGGSSCSCCFTVFFFSCAATIFGRRTTLPAGLPRPVWWFGNIALWANLSEPPSVGMIFKAEMYGALFNAFSAAWLIGSWRSGAWRSWPWSSGKPNSWRASASSGKRSHPWSFFKEFKEVV